MTLSAGPAFIVRLGSWKIWKTPEGTIRLSLSRFTEKADADRVLEAVAAMRENY